MPGSLCVSDAFRSGALGYEVKGGENTRRVKKLKVIVKDSLKQQPIQLSGGNYSEKSNYSHYCNRFCYLDDGARVRGRHKDAQLDS